MAKLTSIRRICLSEAVSLGCVLAFTLFMPMLPATVSLPLLEYESPDLTLTTDEIMAFAMLPTDICVKVNDTFVVQVGIENATDMLAWQVYLQFEPWMLECIGVRVPSEHVYSYGITVGDLLFEYNATEFPHRLALSIQNSEGRIPAGNCLMGNQSTFNGSGILCEIVFRAVYSGYSSIRLYPYSTFDSCILDSNLKGIVPSFPVYSYVESTES